MAIIWCMVPETWSMTHIIFLSFWTAFSPFTPLRTWKVKVLKNWKKITGDIIILQKCTKSHDHMLYCSLDMAHNGFNCYFSIWTIFCPFTSLTAQNIKTLKKNEKKMPANIIILQYCTKNHDHMLYCSWDIVCDWCNYFSFWAIFYPFIPITVQKIKILQKWKKHQEI